MLWYSWFVARNALGVGEGMAVLIVALDFVISLFLNDWVRGIVKLP